MRPGLVRRRAIVRQPPPRRRWIVTRPRPRREAPDLRHAALGVGGEGEAEGVEAGFPRVLRDRGAAEEDAGLERVAPAARVERLVAHEPPGHDAHVLAPERVERSGDVARHQPGREALGVGRARVPGDLGRPDRLVPARLEVAGAQRHLHRAGELPDVGDHHVVRVGGRAPRLADRVRVMGQSVEVGGPAGAPVLGPRAAAPGHTQELAREERRLHPLLPALRLAERSGAGRDDHVAAPDLLRPLVERVQEPLVDPGAGRSVAAAGARPLRVDEIRQVGLVPRLVVADAGQARPGCVDEGARVAARHGLGEQPIVGRRGAPGAGRRERVAARSLGPIGCSGEGQQHRDAGRARLAHHLIGLPPDVAGPPRVASVDGRARLRWRDVAPGGCEPDHRAPSGAQVPEGGLALRGVEELEGLRVAEARLQAVTRLRAAGRGERAQRRERGGQGDDDQSFAHGLDVSVRATGAES